MLSDGGTCRLIHFVRFAKTAKPQARHIKLSLCCYYYTVSSIGGLVRSQIATISSKLNLVEYVSILLRAGASPDLVEVNSWTPLMQLIYRASDDPFKMRMYVEAIQLLIDAGCDVNRAFKPDTKFSRTALMMAVLKDLLSIVEVLLDAGADPDLASKYCWASHDNTATAA